MFPNFNVQITAAKLLENLLSSLDINALKLSSKESTETTEEDQMEIRTCLPASLEDIIKNKKIDWSNKNAQFGYYLAWSILLEYFVGKVCNFFLSMLINFFCL
jgi:hypothetical protein